MRGLIASAGLVAALAFPCAATASPTQQSIFQDDDMLIHVTPAEADATMAELKSLGVDRVRLSVIWKDIAPDYEPIDATDPKVYAGEGIDHLDAAVRAAAANGIGALLNVRGGAPQWARVNAPSGPLAGRDGNRPDPVAFGKFAHMLGRRYDGSQSDRFGQPLPRVDHWSIWNEPNWGGHLQPQSVRDPETRLLRTVSPGVYRELYRAAAAGLAATGHGADTILIGETAPIGSRKLGELSPLSPVRFLRDLFCLDRALKPVSERREKVLGCDFRRRGPLPASGYGHHPYPLTAEPGRPSADPTAISLADADRLYRILDAATKAGRLPARLDVYYTEFGYQTDPPDPFRGVSLANQAAWLIEAEHMTYADKRVAGLTQFLLRDDEGVAIYDRSDARHWRTYQTGLEFADGTPKPAYDAYRLPFHAPVGLRRGAPLLLWGMVRPGADGVAQHVRVQFRPGGEDAWQTVSEFDVTSPRGYFTATVRSAQPGQYRFEWIPPAAPGDPGAPPPARRRGSAPLRLGVG